MSGEAQVRPFPRGALIAGAVLIGTSLAFATVARLTDIGASRLALAPESEKLELAFVDLPNGSVGVRRMPDGHQLVALEPGESGFVRVVLRGLAHDRHKAGVGAEPPFLLTRHADGALTLSDPSTDRVVTLSAFGWSNEEAFARLLELGRTSS